MHGVDWDDLRYVLAIARGRTLSRAAERMGATHTTVGRRLRALEQAMGARLFDPTPDGFTPTAAGRQVIDAAERMESETMALEARVLGQDTHLEGKLRVATLDLLLRRFIGAFSAFVSRYPSVELTVTTSDVEVSLARREADVAFRMTNTPPETLVGRKVGRVPFAVYASAELVQRVGADAPLSAYPWIHWDERLQPTWLDEWLAAHAPGARVAARVDVGLMALRELVASGLGVHFLACPDGDADPSLVRISPVEPTFERSLWLLTLEDLRNTSRVRAFMDHLEPIVRAASE